jgi:nucleoid DNA-binding protein
VYANPLSFSSMQQLLYKYLILNNRLNIPSLGSFSVSYQPAKLNSSTGNLDPKQPVLHFKDGPPATPDTGLLPFLAAEMGITPAAAANELLNFSLQVMSELVENKRARLRGLGTLTKDLSGNLYFDQENSSVPVQTAVVAKEPAFVAAPMPAAPVPTQPVVAAPYPSIPDAELPARTATPVTAPPTASKLPPGQLDPSLDYGSINTYQESPELAKVRQQLAQRREQVNAVFGDLREARERMNRVPMPGQPATNSPAPSSTGSSTNSFQVQPIVPPRPRPEPPPLRTSPTTGRRPNPLLTPNQTPAEQPIRQRDESAPFRRDSDALSGLPIEMPQRPSLRPKSTPPFAGDTPQPSRPAANPIPPVEDTQSIPAWGKMNRPVPPVQRGWNPPDRETENTIPYSRPPVPEVGNVRDMRKSPLRKQPLPITPPAEEASTEPAKRKWPWKRAEATPTEAFSLPERFAEEEETEEAPRPGFFSRIKASIAGIFSRKQEETTTQVEEQYPDEEESPKGVVGLFNKASSKLSEIRNNELETDAAQKKDFWWIYSIFLASVATLALILHML